MSASIPFILLQTVAVPLVFSLVTFALGSRLGRHVGWVAFGSLLYTTLLMVAVGVGLFNGGAPLRSSTRGRRSRASASGSSRTA